MKRIHVCLITTGNIEQTCGGEEKFTRSYSGWLRSNGFEVTVLHSKLFQVVGITNNSLDVTSRNEKNPASINAPILLYQLYLFLFSCLCILRILNIHKRQKVSIIHAQDTRHSGLSAIVAGRLIGVPVIIHSHGHAIESLNSVLRDFRGIRRYYMSWVRAILVIVHRTVVNHSSVIVAVSETVKNRLAQDSTKNNKIFVIPVGIDIPHFRAKTDRNLIRKELQIPPDSLVVSFIGRLSPEKNIITLIKAFGMFAHEHSEAKLLIIGDGNMRNELERFTYKSKLCDSVIFAGYRSNISDFLNSIDIFVLPSYVEGCPIALLEAMASEKAVVASSIPAIREIIANHENGLLFNPTEPNELKNALLLLSTNSRLKHNLMNKAYLTSLGYQREKLFGEILKLYFEISPDFRNTKAKPPTMISKMPAIIANCNSISHLLESNCLQFRALSCFRGAP